MKILTRLPLLALTCLAIPFFASAQIAPSGIFREQPTPAPASTPSPTPPPAPTATPAPAATPRTEIPNEAEPESKPAPKPSARPIEKAETKPAEPVASAPVADERPTGSGAGIVFKLRQLEKEWEASPHDAATIQKIIADDFIGVTGEGKIVTKKAMLKAAGDSKDESSSSVGHMDVRLHGASVAIVVGTAKKTTKDKAGRKSTTSYRFTDTWMARGGNWQCVASQATELSKNRNRETSLLPTESTKNRDRETPPSPPSQTGSNLPRRQY